MTSGAGGFSIGTNLTYYRTIDRGSDPSFRIMRLLEHVFWVNIDEIGLPFMIACVKKLKRLFDEKKAYPNAVTDREENLLHFDSRAVRHHI